MLGVLLLVYMYTHRYFFNSYEPVNFYGFHGPLSFFSFLMLPFLVLMLLDLILRGVALWRAARANQNFWFIALLVLNTLSILPVIYLVFFADESLYKNWQKTTVKITSKKLANKPVSRKKR